MITLNTIVDILKNTKYKFDVYENYNCITFYYENGDRTRIEIGDDKNSIAVNGKIIGGTEEFKDWLYS